MDKRPFFLAGDLVSNTLVAALSGVVIHSLMSNSWPMMIAMLLGMVIGMFVANLCCFVGLMRYFGAMEIMVPAMTSGMVAGMVVAMSRAMTSLTLFDHLLVSIICGILLTVIVWVVDTRLSGEQINQTLEGNIHD